MAALGIAPPVHQSSGGAEPRIGQTTKAAPNSSDDDDRATEDDLLFVVHLYSLGRGDREGLELSRCKKSCGPVRQTGGHWNE